MSHVTLIQEIQVSNDRIWTLDWHPKMKIFACSGADKQIRIFGETQLNSGKYEQKQLLVHEHEKTIRSLKFSPDGQLLASSSFDATINIFRYNNGEYKLLQRLEGHENEVKCVDWDSTCKFLVSCSRDKSIWVWDCDQDFEFSCYNVLESHTQDVKYVKFLPNSCDIISCSYDDTIKVWIQNDDEWDCNTTLQQHQSTVWAIDIDKNGDIMASVSEDKTINIWLKNQQPFNKNSYFIHSQCLKDYHDRPIYSCSFNSDAMFLATVGADNTLNIFTKQTTGIDQQIQFVSQSQIQNAHTQDINVCKFNPCEDILLTASDDRKIKIWKVEY